MDKGEIFTKADLSEVVPKTKAKLKKRELAKARSKPSAKRVKDNAKSLSLRSKQQLVNQENRLVMAAPVIGLGRSKNQPFAATNGRLRTLHSSKAKVSETVTSRKALGSLEPNIPSKNQFHYDLQRVLGKDGRSGSPPPPQEPITASESEKHVSTIPTSGTRMETSAPSTRPSLPRPSLPLDEISQRLVQETHMEASAPSGASSCPSLPLDEISQRLVEGLQVDVIFPNSSYLGNVRAELKKVLKQSNPYGYQELVDYFSAADSTMATPFINQLQHAMLPGAGACEVVPACDPDIQSLTNSPASNTVSDMNPPTSNAVSDIVALNLEVNTSALNINDQVSPNHTPRPRDFLDLVDSVTADWNATPTRPRMFPHKLY